ADLHHHRDQGRADLRRAQPQDGLADRRLPAGRVRRRRAHGDPRAEGQGQRGAVRPVRAVVRVARVPSVVTVELTAATADETRAAGFELARSLRAGDLVILTGDL